MINSLGNNLAGLKAYSTQVNASAHNIANVNTDEFKSQDAIVQEDQNSQPKAVVRKDNSPGAVKQTISEDGKEKLQEMSNTDIAKEMVKTISAEKAYTANLKTVETQDQMAGSIINIKG